MKSQAIQPVDTHALKYRFSPTGRITLGRCGELSPACAETILRRCVCVRKMYHKGLHRSKKYMWANGDYTVRRKGRNLKRLRG